jgi:hypothetical protein
VPVTRAALLLFVVGLPAMSGIAPAAAQGDPNEVAYVESVSGRVVALAGRKSQVLDVLDTIEEGAWLELSANSELRLCHYHTEKFLILQGPMRASISYEGVKATTGRGVSEAAGRCGEPIVSAFQGGIVARGARTTLRVPLRSRIKVVNRTANGIRKMAIWDDAEQKIVAGFDRDVAAMALDEGRQYHLVIARDDGPELKFVLRPNSAGRAGPVILVIQ